MALTINTRAYTLDRPAPDANVFVGPAHTFSTADKAEMKRVPPKPTKDFKGVARPTFKMTRSVVIDTVAGTRADAILTVSASLPVGISNADVDTLLADTASFCESDDAKDLFKKLDIQA